MSMLRSHAMPGRAGKLGLAISLVSTVEEKVWYCTKKGYKPWTDPAVKDTRTHEHGGHAIWYNEQTLLRVSQTSLACAPRPNLPANMFYVLDSAAQSCAW